MNDTISGRFVLRLPPALHAALRDAARASGLSLNQYCVRKLASSTRALDLAAAEAVARALAVAGEDLVGVAVFGSWSRLQASAGSDVDLLIVIRPDAEITRSLYEAWDRGPVRWAGHAVEPHFVHLPAPGQRISGLWAEVAVDGIVLFEPGLELSRHLVGLRHRIVSGGWVRRFAQGQPYWVEVA
jgi:hypothetical protein